LDLEDWSTFGSHAVTIDHLRARILTSFPSFAFNICSILLVLLVIFNSIGSRGVADWDGEVDIGGTRDSATTIMFSGLAPEIRGVGSFELTECQADGAAARLSKFHYMKERARPKCGTTSRGSNLMKPKSGPRYTGSVSENIPDLTLAQ
jgi:hypothetical protein